MSIPVRWFLALSLSSVLAGGPSATAQTAHLRERREPEALHVVARPSAASAAVAIYIDRPALPASSAAGLCDFAQYLLGPDSESGRALSRALGRLGAKWSAESTQGALEWTVTAPDTESLRAASLLIDHLQGFRVSADDVAESLSRFLQQWRGTASHPYWSTRSVMRRRLLSVEGFRLVEDPSPIELQRTAIRELESLVGRMQTARRTVIFVGDPRSRTLDALSQRLAAWPIRSDPRTEGGRLDEIAPDAIDPDEMLPEAFARDYTAIDAPGYTEAWIRMAFFEPARSTDGALAFRAAELIAANGFSSILVSELRSRLGLVYGVGIERDEFPQGSLCSVALSTSVDRIADVLDAASRVMREALTARPDPTRVDAAKNQLELRTIEAVESSAGRARLAYLDLRDHGRVRPLEELLQDIRRLSEREVWQALSRFDPSSAAIFCAGQSVPLEDPRR